MSGAGVVADGCEWSDYRVTIRWRGTGDTVRSTSDYDTISELVQVHGHNGATRIAWIDPPRQR
jgi:hypothetical protein